MIHLLKRFCFNLITMINRPKCFKNTKKPSCIYQILRNCPKSFQNSCAIQTGLSHFNQLIVIVKKTTDKESQPKVITYWSYKYFNNYSFRKELLQIEASGNNCEESFQNFTSSCNIISNKHALQKRYARVLCKDCQRHLCKDLNLDTTEQR